MILSVIPLFSPQPNEAEQGKANTSPSHVSRMKAWIVLLSFLTASLAVGDPSAPDAPGTAVDEQHGPEACEVLGFTAALSCSTCESIKDILADEGLTEECLRCCQETKRSTKKYASARLVYDPRVLGADAELRGFVEDRAGNYPSLTLQATMYAKTVLLMSEEGDGASAAETVSIRRWKVDSIAGYLNEHLH